MAGKNGLEILKTIGKYMKESEGFDSVLKKVKFVGGGNGNCIAELTVEKEHLNRGGGLHGGLSSTLVDTLTTCALMTHDNEAGLVQAGVSVDLHITFLKGAKENDELVIDARTIKCGRTLAFLECEIRNKKNNTLLVRGSHTKFVGSG